MVNEVKATIGIRVTETGTILFATDFLNSANNFLRLLSEVDIALPPNFARSAEWSIRELWRYSPAVLVVEPILRKGQFDNRRAIVDTVMEGVSVLKERDNRPRYFSDQALASARELVSVLGEQVHKVEIFTPDTNIICTEAIAANIRKILHPGREILGSTEGYIESLNSHGGFEFVLYEPIFNSRIECQLEPSLKPDDIFRLRKEAYTLYEKKVRISGLLRTNRKGEVRSARVSTIDELRAEPKFSDVKAISGIFDITGGLEASEYIGRMRDA